MKAVKISLAVMVIVAIAFFVFRSSERTEEVGEIQQSENTSVVDIQAKITELSQKPHNRFCKDFYDEIAYYIDDDYKNGKFDDNQSNNEQWKNNLTKQLYSAYADKFIGQVLYVFNRPKWESSDLSFIRSEYTRLQRSPLLERGSPVAKRFNEIKTVFDKYDEIRSFIASCKSFGYNRTGLYDKYPMSEVSGKIAQAKTYRENRLGNSYVNNCAALHSELDEVPQILFQKHVRYLDNVMNAWRGKYVGYNLQKTYVSNLYKPIADKIDELDNDLYNVPNFRREYSRLKTRWTTDARNAYSYFEQK